MIQVEVTFIPPIQNASKEQIETVAQTTFFQIEKTMLIKNMLIHILTISQHLLLENETYCQSVFPLIQGSSTSSSFRDLAAFWALSYETGQFNTSFLASTYINLPYSIMISKYFPNMYFLNNQLEHESDHVNVFDYYFRKERDQLSSQNLTLKFYLQCKFPSCENCSSEIALRTPFRMFDLEQRNNDNFMEMTKEEKNNNDGINLLEIQNTIFDTNVQFINFEKEMFAPIHRCLLGHVLCSSCYFMLMQSQLDFFCPICDEQLHQKINI